MFGGVLEKKYKTKWEILNADVYAHAKKIN